MATSEMMGLKLGLMLALIGMIGQTTTTLAHHVYHYEAAPEDMITREQLMEELNSEKGMESYDVYKLFVKASGNGFKLEELSVDELLGLNTWKDRDCEAEEYRRRAWLCIRRKAESHLVAKKVESYCTIVNREYAEKCAPIVYRMAEKELANHRETIERFYKDVTDPVYKFGTPHEWIVRKVLDEKDYDYTALERACSLMDGKYEPAFNRAKNFGALSDYFKFCNHILRTVKTEGELNFVYRYEAPEVKITIEDLHRKLDVEPMVSFHSGLGFGVYKLLKSLSNRDDQVSKVSVGEVIELNTWLNSECNEPEYKRRKELCDNFKIVYCQVNDNLDKYCGAVNRAFYETCSARLYKLAEKELADHEEAVEKFHGDVQKYVLKREPHEKAVSLVLAKEKGNDKAELLNLCSILDEKYGLVFHPDKYNRFQGLWSDYYSLCNYIRKFEYIPKMKKFLMKKLP